MSGTPPVPPGLCSGCRHARPVESGRGVAYLLCGLSRTDPRFPRYPRLPVDSCDGFEAEAAPRIDDARVRSTWTPLAASWLLMALELPGVSAVMARLAQPEISLAAYGGVVLPLAMLIEAPIIMMLSASTSLSRDRVSHRKLARFVFAAGATLTGVHLAVVATPLFDVVVGKWMGAPEEIRGAAHTGLWIMLPWTWSIAYRRFQQGVLIRTGHSRYVSAGTAIRLGTCAAVLATGWALGRWPGIVVGATGMAAGVMAEAAYIGRVVQPHLRRLPEADPSAPVLTRTRFVHFYTPLLATALLTMSSNTLASSAMSRMPRALDSLAAWPVVTGLTFTLRSLGFAFHEVVVALLGSPGAAEALTRFARRLSVVASGSLALIALTPLAHAWFAGVSGLPAPLASLAGSALILAIPLPALAVAQSRLSGTLVHAHATRGVLEAVAVQLATMGAVLAAGAAWGGAPGVRVAVASALVSQVAQNLWLKTRARRVTAATPTP